jgi:FkbM family methyltransferase
MTQDLTGPLAEMLTRVGKDGDTRAAVVKALVAWEARHQAGHDGEELRETVTGPIVDALYRSESAVTRRLASGIVFTLPYRSKIAREFAMAGEPLSHVWEPQTSRLLVALAERARTVVIGGAYAGDQAIPVAQVLAKRGGQVHCFELNRVQLAALEANAKRNGLDNVIVNAIGLWDRSGHVELVGHDSHAFPKFVERPSAESFPVVAIDAYAKSAGVGQVDLIMLDIEGGEESALRGAIGFLDQPAGKAPDLVFEIHRAYVDWSQGLAATPVVRMLTDRGYTVYPIRDYQANVDMTGKPLEMVTIESAYLEGPPHGFNLFATKRKGLLDELGVKLREGLSPKLLRHRLSPLHQPG